MKKIKVPGLLIIVLFSFNSRILAQAFGEGKNQINVGIGIGATFLIVDHKISTPPITASFEHGINDNVSIGGYLGFAGSTIEQVYSSAPWKWTYSYVMIGGSVCYHFATGDHLDPYLGVGLGYNISAVKVDRPQSYSGSDIVKTKPGGVMFVPRIGARYLFNDNIGIFGELGYGIAILQLGATLEF